MPTDRGARRAASLLAAVLLLGGCATGQDDELVRDPQAPRTTVAATPASPAAAPLPGRIPVGATAFDLSVPVWAQGTVLHVGDRSADVSPRRIEAFVVTRGGVYFLDDDEMWFTDLAVVRATGLTGVRALVTDQAGRRIRVTTSAGGSRTSRGYDTTDGSAVPAGDVRPATARQRHGRPGSLALRTERSDVSPTRGPVPVRQGTGKYGLVDVEGGPLVAYDTTYDLRIALTGVVGTGFELVSWTGPATFYGLALRSGRPVAVLGCDIAAGRCRTWGSVDADGSLLFQSGT